MSSRIEGLDEGLNRTAEHGQRCKQAQSELPENHGGHTAPNLMNYFFFCAKRWRDEGSPPADDRAAIAGPCADGVRASGVADVV